ncbi:uncharacterized protein BX664DRAFT_324781 [Halteromyces radiatus]|uniref:uncharacterized protein n=1 Tax=Halteromyces radiatus TaxID=101107 RepID=UPI002220C9A1|nr:uncharacterized protein BX664DRAFT_324781 [Halteromyces radiatus]KAI8096769.1 hypothetical protein BX664DRAFT_324781 [Halteromyces radiatus]
MSQSTPPPPPPPQGVPLQGMSPQNISSQGVPPRGMPPNPYGGPPPPGFMRPPPPAGFPSNGTPPPPPPSGGFMGRPPLPTPVPGVGIRGVPAGLPVSKQVLNTTPSRTIYVSNLNEKVKIDVLKNTLRNLFQQFGEVLDVVAHGNIRMRGQAFIAYPTEECGENAIKELQHFSLYGKPMVVQFARNKSDVHARKDGDYEEHYKARIEKKEQVKLLPLPGSHKPTFKAPGTRSKTAKAGAPQRNAIPDDYLPPNSILFLQNLPETTTQEYLVELFETYPGFKEVRMIPTKKSIAFVEYETDYQASLAKMELANHRIDDDHLMKVTFARK